MFALNFLEFAVQAVVVFVVHLRRVFVVIRDARPLNDVHEGVVAFPQSSVCAACAVLVRRECHAAILALCEASIHTLTQCWRYPQFLS